jgi:phosphoglycolate phosphatase-like HAD superfamily hydrolase
MILKAMELLGGTPDDTVYVGDAVGDIQAARAAGVRAVAMTTGGGSKELLASLGAWRTADKLSEILEML